jgi:hypothetical protein
MQPKMEHVLVIGGSGILRELCCRFADRGKAVSVVGRDKKKIVTIVSDTQKSPGVVNPIDVDYTDIPAFKHKLTEAIAHLGPPEIIIDYSDPEAGETREFLLHFAAEKSPDCRFYDLLKLKLTGPESPFADRRTQAEKAGIDYYGIIMGFSVKGEDVGPLTAKEMASEVLASIVQGEKESVVGTIVRHHKKSPE